MSNKDISAKHFQVPFTNLRLISTYTASRTLDDRLRTRPRQTAEEPLASHVTYSVQRHASGLVTDSNKPDRLPTNPCYRLLNQTDSWRTFCQSPHLERSTVCQRWMTDTQTPNPTDSLRTVKSATCFTTCQGSSDWLPNPCPVYHTSVTVL